jgi:hypothetical protein
MVRMWRYMHVYDLLSKTERTKIAKIHVNHLINLQHPATCNLDFPRLHALNECMIKISVKCLYIYISSV